jgi:DNA-binding transcriptional ArsR family regulator
MTTHNLIRIFGALSDPTRARILKHLSEQVLCVGALAQRLGVTHSAVSQHLRILREAGLVQGDKRGYWVHYSLDRRQIRTISAQISRWLEGLSSGPAGECGDTAKCPRKGKSRRGKSGTRR